jgi:hypothetical protein
VSDFAKAALGWRRLDADLAELLEDSALESESTALARGGGRLLTFRSDALTIDVQIDSGLLLGQLAPGIERAAIELQDTVGAVAATAESDALGRFRFALPDGERFRLRVLRPDSSAIETSWFSV